MSTTTFATVEVAPPIEVFNLTKLYNEDSFPSKVNLGVGAYRTDDGKPWVLPSVRSVEKQIAEDLNLDHEYLPISGLRDYRDAGLKLLLGDNSPAVVANRAAAVQSLGGTGAIRIGMEFLVTRLNYDTIYVSKPTWGNHKGIAKSVGFKNVKEYRYWDDAKRAIDIDGMLEDLTNAPSKSVILLHMSAHNPTGMDPTQEQWQLIAKVMREKNHFVFFDCAYQGFSSGNLDKDAWALRHFIDDGFEMFACQSFSKNFGLYNERCGNLIVVSNDPAKVVNVISQLEIIVRETWSNPPAHGARVIATIVKNPALHAEWKDNVRTMAERILLMRQMLYERLRANGTPGNWEHVIKQTGMFSFTGLNPRQCDHLIKQYHIYLMRDGRINMCAVTTKNVDYIANAIHETVTSVTGDPKL